MSLSAAGFSAFSTRVVAATVVNLPAVITYGGTTYACTIDPSALTQGLEELGMKAGQSLELLVANSAGLTPALGRNVTITTTVTDALEGVVFTVAAITAHPNLPATVLTVERRP